MPSPTIQQATALIDHIQTRFHDGHRRDLPALLALAAEVEACGIGAELVDALRTIGDHLELHMFKEEMRLFPMMEQGGNNTGPMVNKIIKANGGDIGEPWCGDFVAYCYRQAGSKAVTRSWASVRALGGIQGVRRVKTVSPASKALRCARITGCGSALSGLV